MDINVNWYDFFEVKYTDNRNEEKVHIESLLDLAKAFVGNAKDNHFSISSVAFYIKVGKIEGYSSKVSLPDRKLAERKFSPEDFLHLSDDEVKGFNEVAKKEVASYIKEYYGITLAW